MGTWDTEMRGSDDALDAVDAYQDQLDALGDKPDRVAGLLQSARRRFGNDGVLGLADAMLEKGIDLRTHRRFLKTFIDQELSQKALQKWEDESASRKKALHHFYRRLAFKPKPPPAKPPKKEPGPMRIPGQFQVGRYVKIRPGNMEPGIFSKEGLCSWPMGKRYGYFNRSRRIVIPPIFDWADDFYEGLAPAKLHGKFGIINTKGRWVAPPQWDNLRGFHEGRAAFMVKKGRKEGYGFVDRRGRIIAPPVYDWFEPFSNGMARVDKNFLWGYINRAGELVVPCTLQEAKPFQRNGTAKAQDAQGRWGRLDRKGRWL